MNSLQKTYRKLTEKIVTDKKKTLTTEKKIVTDRKNRHLQKTKSEGNGFFRFLRELHFAEMDAAQDTKKQFLSFLGPGPGGGSCVLCQGHERGEGVLAN